jgi:hypothetical protein
MGYKRTHHLAGSLLYVIWQTWQQRMKLIGNGPPLLAGWSLLKLLQ